MIVITQHKDIVITGLSKHLSNFSSPAENNIIVMRGVPPPQHCVLVML